MKKLLVALLGINALLIALLTAQATQAAWTKSEITRVAALEKRVQQLEQLVQNNPSQATQSATKTYDAVKLAEYSACLATSTASNWLTGNAVTFCAKYLP